MNIFWIILGGSYVLALVVKKRLSTAYQKWGTIRNSANMTGAATTSAILRANDMHQIQVLPVPGNLTDHYNPRDKTIQLSEAVFDVPSVAAMAIAAHETGHAIQDKVGYWPLEIRTTAAPMVNAAARYGVPAALVGLFLGMPLLMQLGVIGYVGALAFQFLTLPVEFDASKRAMAQLDRLQLLNDEERKSARSMLSAAAMTYVAGAASSAVYILYLMMMGGRWLLSKSPRLP